MWCGTGSCGKLLRHMTKQANNCQQYLLRTGRLWLAGSFISILSATLMPASVQAQGATDFTNQPALDRCGIVDYERILQQRNPNRLRQLMDLNRRIEQVQSSRSARSAADDEVYRIPVVVHVVHSTASGEIGGPTNVNISEEQIQSQIQVLNEDYRRQSGTNGYNTNPLGADAKIEFYLANIDPDGNPTNGITRHYYPEKASFNVADNSGDDILLSQIAYWPSDRYLNIWVTRVNQYLGFTQFPTMADTLSGLPSDTNEFTDGTIIDYRYFGRQTGSVRDPGYALGRTATHEIGHWLGLIHLNGDTDCGTDYIADTPPTDDLNQTRFCREIFANCSGQSNRVMIENYMMYSPDACMNLFTTGQVARMRTVLALSPRRARLIRSASSPLTPSENLTLTVYPNPALVSTLR